MTESDSTSENDVYHGYSVDSEDQPDGDASSSADDRGLVDPLEEGYSPPERWSVAEGYGNTPLEEELGETLDQRLAQEIPEPDPYAEAGVLDDPDGDVAGGEVGDLRAGRLVEGDEGVREDTESELFAEDVGIDGAGASAEEAAVHIIPDELAD